MLEGTVSVEVGHKRTGQLVSSQTEGISDDLFVEHALDLEEDLVDSHSRSPVIKGALSLTHTHLETTQSIIPFSIPIILEYPGASTGETSTNLVSANKHTDITSHPLVQPVLLPSQSGLDRVFRNLELLRTDASVVVRHAQAVVAPDDRRSPRRTSCSHASPALHLLELAVNHGFQPGAELGGRGRERPGMAWSL